MTNVRPDEVLPQNIISIGEHVVEDKNIYISQSVYKEIHKFTKDKTTNESGGVLLGNVIEEFGKTNIMIRGFIEAKHCEGTPTTLTFTHEAWEYIHKEAEKKYPRYTILGWIHTHPNFGIFLSEYDKFIQENFFREENQIAYVVDPIQNIEGFYFRINGKLERCKGFYVFDKVGAKISVAQQEETEEPSRRSAGTSLPVKVLLGILSIAVVMLLIVCISFGSEVKSLRTEIETLNTNEQWIYQNFGLQIDQLTQQVAALEAQQEPASSAIETENPEASQEETVEQESPEVSEEFNEGGT